MAEKDVDRKIVKRVQRVNFKPQKEVITVLTVNRDKSTGILVASIIFAVIFFALAIVMIYLLIDNISNIAESLAPFIVELAFLIVNLFIFSIAISNIYKIYKNNKLLKQNINCLEKKSNGKIYCNVINSSEQLVIHKDDIVKISSNLFLHKHRVVIYYNGENNKILKAKIGYAKNRKNLTVDILKNNSL